MKNVLTEDTPGVLGRASPTSQMRRLFSFPVLLGVLLAAGTLAGRCLNIKKSMPHAGAYSNIPFEGDTWWHIVTGSRILSTGHWPLTDTYSFTVHGNPWIAYEWVGDVTLAVASRLAGLQGLMWLLLLMSGAYVLLLYFYAYQRSRNSMAALLACLALLPLASSFFTLRPQMLGYIFLIATLIILERFRSGYQKALWLMPVIFLFWVNTHGTFVFGFFVMGVYWAAGLWSFQYRYIRGDQWTAKKRQQFGIILLMCLMASIITPYGGRSLAFPLQMILFPSTNLKANSEFLPIRLSTMDGTLILILLLLFVVYIVVARPTFRTEEMVLLAVATYEALAHVRFILLFVPIFVPLLATVLAGWLPVYKNNREYPLLNALFSCAIIASLIGLYPSKIELSRAISNNFPVGTVAYISRHQVPGPMFNQIAWGGYLTWSLTPQHQVFIDSRDVYDYAGVLHDYLGIVDGGPRAFFLLKKYGVRSCLLATGTKLVSLLSTSPTWHEVYHDQMSVLFVHVTNPDAPVSTEDIRKQVPRE